LENFLERQNAVPFPSPSPSPSPLCTIRGEATLIFPFSLVLD
jgi:hypothetical protein